MYLEKSQLYQHTIANLLTVSTKETFFSVIKFFVSYNKKIHAAYVTVWNFRKYQLPWLFMFLIFLIKSFLQRV